MAEIKEATEKGSDQESPQISIEHDQILVMNKLVSN